MSVTASSTEVVTVLAVEGMTCGNCVRHVQEGLGELAGVRAAVDLAAGTATVVHPASLTVADLLAAVDEAGYDAVVRGAAAR